MPHIYLGSSDVDQEELRRCLGDLTAASALPGVWMGMDVRQIVQNLAGSLGRMVDADVLHVSWAVDEHVVCEAAYVDHATGLSSHEQLELSRQLLREVERGADPLEGARAERATSNGNGPVSIHVSNEVLKAHLARLNDGRLRLTDLRFGRGGHRGHLRAASSRTDFPTQTERLVMRVACNQAATTLERLSVEQDLRAKEAELRRKEHELRDFVENAAIGLRWVGPDGTILWANKAELDMLGYRPEEYIGHHLSEFHVDRHVTEDILACLRSHQELPYYEARMRCKDGSVKWTSISSNVYWEDGRFVHTRCFMRDITQRKLAERRLAAKYAVTRLLAEAASFEEAAPRLLQALRECLDVEVCDIWLPDESAGVLRLMAIESDGSAAVESFVEESRRVVFGRGDALPGRVWESGQPEWLDESSAGCSFPRARVAVEAGFQTFAAFPIRVGAEFYGVIGLYGRQRLARDEALLQMMATAGNEIGQFIRQSRAHRALREQEARKAAILESALDCIITMDRQGCIVDFNPAAEKTFGYCREDVVGKSLAETIVPPRFRERHEQGVQRYLRTGVGAILNHRTEMTAMRSDGTEFPIELTITATHPEGAPPFFTAYLRDLTEPKNAERQRRDIEERFTSFMRHLPGAAWIKDPEGRYVYANRVAQETFRIPDDRLHGRTDWEIFPAETARQFRENDRKALESPEGVQTIEQLEQDDGLVHHSLVSKFPILDGTGTAAFVGGVAFDVTPWRQAEAALRESEAQLRAILDNTTSAVFAKDLEGRYFIANRHLAAMFDWPDETWPLGMTDAELFPAEMAEAFAANDRKVLLADAPLEFEEEVVHKGQRTLYFVQKFPLRDSQGTTYGVCGIATDITRRKQTEQMLTRYARQQHAVAELGSTALTEPDLQRVFEQCVTTVADVLGHEYCKVLELLPAGDRLLLRAGVGWRDGLVGQATVSAGRDSQAGFTLACETPVVVDDLREESRFSDPLLLHEHGVVSGMSCVIPGPGGRPWGVLGTHTTKKVQYTKDDVHFLQSVAHIIGGAIQRRAAELALSKNEQRLRFSLNAARVGSWDWDFASGRVSWSENLATIHGLASSTMGGTFDDVLASVYPPDRDRLQEAIHAAVEGDGLFEVDYRFLRADGTVGWLHSQGRAVFAEDGRPVRIAGICLDITERRRSEELTRLLAAAGAHLGQSLDYESTLQIVAELLVPDWGDLCAIDLVDTDGSPRCVAVSLSDRCKAGAARDLARHHPFRSNTRHGFLHVVKTGQTELLPEIPEALLEESAESEEHLALLREFGLQSAVVVPLNARGRTLGTLTLCSADSTRRYNTQDASLLEELAIRCALAVDNARLYEEAQQEIALRKRTERLLAKAHDAAAAANAAKSEFLASMSHEIRTPMTAILGYADILRERLTSPQDREAVETIRRNGRFLLEIINDILDLSKIEAGKLEVEHQRFRPDELVAEVISLMEVRAHEKQLTLSARFDGAVPETIETDPVRLRQILINLVGNAIKFTRSGRVEVCVRLLPEEEMLQFEVMDTGIGMTPEQLRQLFEPFTQGDAGVPQRDVGSGLGLAISRRLAELLGGEISVVSEAGKGSTFTLRIATGSLQDVPRVEPRFDVQSTPSETDSPATSLDCCVLVVDDRRDVRYLAEHFIEEAGGRVMTATNGEEALEVMLQAQATGQPIDLILLDMQMPVLDGYEAAARLRALGFRGPIIALTAHAMHGDRERCLEAGCDDYTSKPLNGPHLVELIARYTRQPAAARVPERRETPPAATRPFDGKVPAEKTNSSDAVLQNCGTAGGGCRVLLVDDSAELCRMMKILLESRGHEVQSCQDGRSAIEQAQAFAPDVVLLDLKLPDMSGYDVVGQLKTLRETREAVLIALSGDGESTAHQRARQAGFHHFVLKPADVDEIEQYFPITAGSSRLPETL